MFDRLTQASKDLLLLARQEATAGGYKPIGAEHILLALSGQGGTLAGQILRDAELHREQLLSYLPSNDREPNVGLAFTELAKRVMTAARSEADALLQSEIAPEHYLLGLLDQRGTAIEKLLTKHGLILEVLRERVQRR
jgi:ATP-dependent Clp protease ATP-binding subunit ClpC